MSSAPNQLVEIHRQLREQFSSHTTISFTPIKGDPPDQYEVTYALNGLSKTGSGDIIVISRHVVELTIPYGFPHFPPSCKPKSDIFHPDFDPAAIFLGDFWNQDSGVSDLIIYIGRMINGEIYSRNNPFNEDASIWYQDHPDTLPLTDIIWNKNEPELDVPATNNDSQGIDTLDENDLSTEFNFLALEDSKAQEDLPNGSLPIAESALAIDLEYLQLLESQKKFFKLREILKGIGNIPGRIQNLSVKTEKNIGKAEDLHRQAKKNEQRGDIPSALALFQHVAAIAGDFPNIEADLKRVRQALADLEDIEEDEPADCTDETALPINKQLSEGKEPKTTKIRSAKIKQGGPKSEGKKDRASNLRRMRHVSVCLAGGLGAVIFASCGYYYWMMTDRLASADSAYSQCSALVNKEQYEDAKRFCEQALAASHDVKFIHRKKVVLLRERVDHILQSETFIQGLNGKILVDGLYLSKKDAEISKTFRQLQKEAEEFFLQENWPQAIDRCAGIIAISQSVQNAPADIATEAKIKQNISLFRMAYDAAEKIQQNEKWQEAITELKKAEPFLALLPESDRRPYADLLRKSLAKSIFEQSREQGDDFLDRSDWQKAIAAYKIALSAHKDLEDKPEESFEAVQKNMKRAELYDLIDQGNKTFGSGFWDEAIANYSKAEAFLTDHQALLKTVEGEMSLRKLSRIILQALIVRDRQLAANHLAKNDLATASEIYRQLLEKIKRSSFAGESEFREIGIELAATIQTLDEKILLADKSQYLEDNFQTIFIANYPNVIKENLANPIMTLTRDTGDKMVFKMQCTESGGGRPLTLIMHYAFDKKNNQWQPFSEL